MKCENSDIWTQVDVFGELRAIWYLLVLAVLNLTLESPVTGSVPAWIFFFIFFRRFFIFFAICNKNILKEDHCYLCHLFQPEICFSKEDLYFLFQPGGKNPCKIISLPVPIWMLSSVCYLFQHGILILLKRWSNYISVPAWVEISPPKWERCHFHHFHHFHHAQCSVQPTRASPAPVSVWGSSWWRVSSLAFLTQEKIKSPSLENF